MLSSGPKPAVPRNGGRVRLDQPVQPDPPDRERRCGRDGGDPIPPAVVADAAARAAASLGGQPDRSPPRPQRPRSPPLSPASTWTVSVAGEQPGHPLPESHLDPQSVQIVAQRAPRTRCRSRRRARRTANPPTSPGSRRGTSPPARRPRSPSGWAKKLRANTSRARCRAPSGNRSRSRNCVRALPVVRGEGVREVHVQQLHGRAARPPPPGRGGGTTGSGPRTRPCSAAGSAGSWRTSRCARRPGPADSPSSGISHASAGSTRRSRPRRL